MREHLQKYVAYILYVTQKSQKSQRTQKYFLEHEFFEFFESLNVTQKSAFKANLGAANTEPSLLELC